MFILTIIMWHIWILNVHSNNYIWLLNVHSNNYNLTYLTWIASFFFWIELCASLSSKMDSIRSETRNILYEIIASVDSSYLPFIIKELKQNLTKGYQVKPTFNKKIFCIYLFLSSKKRFISWVIRYTAFCNPFCRKRKQKWKFKIMKVNQNTKSSNQTQKMQLLTIQCSNLSNWFKQNPYLIKFPSSNNTKK